ncbi:MAG: cytochrome c3 family protein [Pirellulales bacterium]
MLEDLLFCLALTGGAMLLAAAVLGQRRLAHWARVPAIGALVGCAAATLFVAADEPQVDKPAEANPAAAKKWVKPDNWPKDHPLPLVESNCARCHLTAGRELTAAVVNFTRSVHDLQEMSCADCHGGNTKDDVKAHEEAFDFIGTKKSAHIAGCSQCHDEEAKVLASGPHAWDFSKKINTEYPMCFDCHGNHDIGFPPQEFSLAAWCADCHDEPEKEFPHLASVVAENDRLWSVLRKVHQKNVASGENPVPEPLRDEVAGVRKATMQAVHTAREITAPAAAELNQRATAIRKQLDEWLQSKP